MSTQKKTPYYLIIEITGNVAKEPMSKQLEIRGLYSTQAKAIAELFRILTKHQDEGATLCDNIHKNPPTPLSQLIYSHTYDSETSILGMNPEKQLIFELQIKPISPDTPSLIIP